jgi:hypothetical protein
VGAVFPAKGHTVTCRSSPGAKRKGEGAWGGDQIKYGAPTRLPSSRSTHWKVAPRPHCGQDR